MSDKRSKKNTIKNNKNIKDNKKVSRNEKSN